MSFCFFFLCLKVIDVGFNDLHIGHDINHLLFTEQSFGHKAFVLVTTSGDKDKKQCNKHYPFHSESVANIREELDTHQSDFLFLIFIFTKFTEGGLHII